LISTESEGRDQGRGSVQDMVATLQARREELEARLNDKNRELKQLCIQEAELTGVLPPETPLEPGEFPPTFRRRVGTAFTYPENLINNNELKSKEVYLFRILKDVFFENPISELYVCAYMCLSYFFLPRMQVWTLNVLFS
jgi:hypothetical protein